MFSKKRIIWLIVSVMIVSFLIWIVPNAIKYRKAVNASGTLTYQAGWTNSIITPCVTTGSPPTCTASDLTNLEAVACCELMTPMIVKCPLHSYVSGIQSGGMGSGALFPDTSISEAGLVAGASVISGGVTNCTMKVVASWGGTSYIVARKVNKAVDWFDYIIAGFKRN